MAYKPKLLALFEIQQSVAAMSETATFEASAKIAHPGKKRKAEHSADWWFSVNEYLTKYASWKDQSNPPFELLMSAFIAFSIETFKEATASSSLEKLKEELREVESALSTNEVPSKLAYEYADCIMCLIDSASRANVPPKILILAFQNKLEKNKQRKWLKNPDNTYSHTKQL